jgi:hypothetical protein
MVPLDPRGISGGDRALDFIFMLTRDDQTVEDCLELVETAYKTGVTHMGFKDVGVDRDTLHELNACIKQTGATSYMEVVSTTSEACLASTRTARDIGVDRLLGGTHAEAILALLDGSGIAYYPFPGRPEGHPTRLAGDASDVAADCRRLEAYGSAGVDLLAFRAVDADPLDLIRAARAATGGELVVAGSIDSPARIRDIAEAGCDAFTIGSAAFDGSFSPRKGSLQSQLCDILAACDI